MALAKRWAKGVDKLLFMSQERFIRAFRGDHYDWTHLEEKVRSDDSWRAFRAYTKFRVFHGVSWVTGDPWLLGVVRHDHPKLRPGDIVLVVGDSGSDRWPIWACSSLGFSFRGYRVRTDREGALNAMVELLVVPPELEGLPLDSPMIESFLLTRGHNDSGQSA